MKKKLLLSLAVMIALTVGVVGMSAFEAHIINVTAKIDNALKVDTTPIEFGTVFPQEAIDETIDIALSESFMATERVDDINYMIRQKPKCIFAAALDQEGFLLPDFVLPTDTDLYAQVTEDSEGDFVCKDDRYTTLPLLCPFLSKHEITEDLVVPPTGGEAVDNDSEGINAFHGPLLGWDMSHTLATQVLGRLAKSEQDISDTWNIDFRVPCFSGQCAQDWEEFVFANNPLAVAADYILEGDLEHALFGCDLWIEVTEVSYTGDLGCNEKSDIILTLDRSGSVSGEMGALKTAAIAFVGALVPSTDGVHIGEVSFSTTANLDEHLTSVAADVVTAINALTAGGNTNLQDAIEKSAAELDDGEHDRTDATSPDYMVIITDGNPTASNNTNSIDMDGWAADAKAAAIAAKAAGITIYVVGVGSLVNASYLENDISSGSGYYFDVADYSALEALLAGLAECNDAT